MGTCFRAGMGGQSGSPRNTELSGTGLDQTCKTSDANHVAVLVFLALGNLEMGSCSIPFGVAPFVPPLGS